MEGDAPNFIFRKLFMKRCDVFANINTELIELGKTRDLNSIPSLGSVLTEISTLSNSLQDAHFSSRGSWLNLNSLMLLLE